MNSLPSRSNSPLPYNLFYQSFGKTPLTAFFFCNLSHFVKSFENRREFRSDVQLVKPRYIEVLRTGNCLRYKWNFVQSGDDSL